MCMMSSPDIPQLPPPAPPPQTEKAPDQAVFKKRNRETSQAAANAGNQSTMLSGMGGVATDSLNIGKASLLGQ